MLGGTQLSAHADVMGANPEAPEEKERLVEEIKGRCKGLIKGGSLSEALALYSHAIEVLPSAVLYGNRSLVHHKMGQHDSAVSDAETAIGLDAGYAKAYYRKGVACAARGDYSEACAAFMSGLEVTPEDASLKSELAKAQAQVAAPAAAPAPAPAPAKAPAPAAAATKKPAAKRTKAKKAAKEEDDEEDDIGDASKLRGYRRTSDGRTTTYFNQELSAEAKALIGDTAPKRIDPAAGGPEAAPAAAAANGAVSAWNHAGTWEERNMTAWAEQNLREALADLQFDTPGGHGPVVVRKVKSCSGDAAITYTRGKKRHVCDFTVELEWALELETGVAKGTMTLQDVSPDLDHEFSVAIEELTNSAARGLVDAYVRSGADGLQPLVTRALGAFVEQFKAL